MDLTGILGKLDGHKNAGLLNFEKGRLVRRDFPSVHKDVQAAIERLKGYGVKAGMRVGIRATNCYPWIVYDLALLALRAQSVAFTEDFFPTSCDELQEKYKPRPDPGLFEGQAARGEQEGHRRVPRPGRPPRA